MLSKEICKKCIEEIAPPCKDFKGWTHRRTLLPDEEVWNDWWDKQFMFHCPMTKMQGVSIFDAAPQECPYCLEQLMTKQTIKHRKQTVIMYLRFCYGRVKSFWNEHWGKFSLGSFLFLLASLLIFLIVLEAKEEERCKAEGLIYVNESDEKELRDKIHQLEKRLGELERKESGKVLPELLETTRVRRGGRVDVDGG